MPSPCCDSSSINAKLRVYIVCLFTSKSAVCLHFLSVYFHIPLAVYLLGLLMLKLSKYVMFEVKMTNEEDDDDDES